MAMLTSITSELSKLQTAGNREGLSNAEKRAIYRQLESLYVKAKESLPEGDAETICKAIDQLEETRLAVIPPQRPKTSLVRGIQQVDMVIRLISCILYHTLLGMITFVPMYLIVPLIDRVLRKCGWPPQYLIYEMARKVTSYLFLYLAGVFFTVEGKEPHYDAPVVVLFQHGSNLDGFMILSSFPQYFKSIGKEDIFLLPYVGWMAYIFGILPIDRKHRNDAIKQMNRATNYCKRGVAVALSPEGTRSKTGHLMRFKKGPFYVQHDADANVVPLVILGSYELWPTNCLFSRAGKVVLRYLPPIKSSELKTKGLAKDALSREVRNQMLGAIDDISSDEKYQPGTALSWGLRAVNVASIVIFWTLVYQLWIRLVLVREWLGVTRLEAWMAFLTYSVTVTLSLYYFHCKRPIAAQRKGE